jgi:hypothetical protein
MQQKEHTVKLKFIPFKVQINICVAKNKLNMPLQGLIPIEKGLKAIAINRTMPKLHEIFLKKISFEISLVVT